MPAAMMRNLSSRPMRQYGSRPVVRCGAAAAGCGTFRYHACGAEAWRWAGRSSLVAMRPFSAAGADGKVELSRAERRRQSRAVKKGRPLAPDDTQQRQQRAVQAASDDSFAPPDVKASGGIVQTVKTQVARHGTAFAGYWGGAWVGMYAIIWAGMETYGVDAPALLHQLGADEVIKTYAGLDVSTWSPYVINGIVAIEINYLLEPVRMPIVFWALRKRSLSASPPKDV